MRRIAFVALMALACSENTAPPSETITPTPPPFPAASSTHGLLYILPAPGDSTGPVYLATPDGNSPRRLRWWQQNTDMGRVEVLPQSGPVFAPDGSHLGFLANGRMYSSWWGLAFVGDTLGAVVVLGCARWPVYTKEGPGIAFSPDGKRVAFNCERPVLPLLVHDLVTYTDQEIPLPEPPLGGLVGGPIAWSPDGKWILDGGMLVSRESTFVRLTMPTGMTGLGWAANGWIIVGPAGLCGTGVYWMEPKADAQLVKLLDAPYRYAAFSPDGTKLLALTSVCSAADTPRAVVLDSKTLKVEVSIPGATWAAWQP